MKKTFNLLGLLSVVVIAFGYVKFGAYFAERRLELAFLPFPIFVGEMLTALCLLIWFLKVREDKFYFTNGVHQCMYLMAFVILKAAFGYFNYGTLALRHSAMFYYILFIGFGYTFFSRKYVKPLTFFAAFLAFVYFFLSGEYSQRWVYTILIGLVVMIARQEWEYIQLFLAIIVFKVFPWKYLFFNDRAVVLGVIVAITFLIFTVPQVIKMRKRLKVLLLILIAVCLGAGYFHYGSKKAINSIFRFKDIYYGFIRNRIAIDLVKDQYRQIPIEEPLFFMDQIEQIDAYRVKPMMLMKNKEGKTVEVFWAYDTKASNGQYVTQDFKKAQKEKGRTVTVREVDQETRLGNVYFRLFIWRDAIQEYLDHASFFGFSFGKPFRSISIEIMNWAREAWIHDGWIAMHNSWLEYIYRGGIVSIILLFFLVFHFLLVINRFIRGKSLMGLLLCSAIIQWFVIACFSVTFELPYTAIPVWFLYGMVWKYSNQIGIINDYSG